MHGVKFIFVFFLGAVVLSTGCSRSDNAPSAEKSSTKQASRGWASDDKPKVVEVALPDPDPDVEPAEPAADRPAPLVQPPEMEQPTTQAETTQAETEEQPSGNAANVDPTDQGAMNPPPDVFAPPESAAVPAVPSTPVAPLGISPGVSPEVTPDVTPEVTPDVVSDVASDSTTEEKSPRPGLRNPLRDKTDPDDPSNPMRPAAPLPLGASPDNRSADAPPAVSPDGTFPSSTSQQQGDPSGKVASGQTEEEPFDPVKENGPIFVGWPQPRLALVMTGRENGYIEPCGCAGLEKMKGGLSRRHSMVESLKKKGWPVVCIDTGSQVKSYGRQTEIKFQITVEALRKIGYDAIGFGMHDLQLPVAELVSVAAAPSPFVSSNVGLFGFDAQLTERTKIVDAGGLKIGITAVLGKKEQAQINNQEIEMADPEEALAKVVPELKKNCNLLVLLAYVTKEESIALGQKFPDFQLVVTTGGPPEPPAEPMRIPGTNSLLIEVGEKSADAVVVGLYDDPKKPLRYQRVPLDSRFEASKDMYRVMVAYQEQLKQLGLEGLGIRPVPHPQSEVNGDFVGSEKCKSCHEESYRVWKKSGHAKAWKTLVENDPPRNFDPECISCHVIGWHPTRYFPYKSGFLGEKKTPQMINVGCESCHGPCGEHCRAENGSDLDFQEKQYKAIRVTKEEAQKDLSKMCQNCHDLDNSPEFNFETYWPKVEHYENED